MARKPRAEIIKAGHEIGTENLRTASSSGAKVVVACKMGIPWFELQLQEERTATENTQTGPRDIKIWVPIPGVVRVHGTSYPRGTPPIGFPERPEMVGGFALTKNVDKDFWDHWLYQQKRSLYVINEMIFAGEDIDYVRSRCLELEAKLSGLEPVNQVKDDRIAKPIHPHVSQIQKGVR